MNRAEIKNLHIKRWYPFENQEEITEILNEPETFGIILRKFSEFNVFSENAMGRRLYDEKTYHIVESLHLEKQGQSFRVNLMGLNSCLFAGYDGDDRQKLALGLYQVDRALNQLDEKALFSIGFFHHPFSCFHPKEKICQNRLKRKLDLILTGHLHEPSNTIIRDAAGRALIICAGSCFETRESQNSFNLVEIDLTNGEGCVQFYKYLPNYDLWKKDTDINPDESDGHFPFLIDAIRKKPLTLTKKSAMIKKEITKDKLYAQVHFIHDYLLPENFTGRLEEHARLTGLIQGEADTVTKKSASLITIQAIGGIGKSCLIRKVVEEFQGESRFSNIIWFSFYEARTEDEIYFFRRVMEELNLSIPKKVKQKKGMSETRNLREILFHYLDRYPTLIILDGLEVIQHSTNQTSPHFGQINKKFKETLKLLSHLCNQSCSTAIVTSRVTLSEFAGVSGYLEISLDVFTPETGAEFLGRLDVDGTIDERIRCVRIFSGHPLCLKAAGKYMQIKHIQASEVEKLTGDPDVFQRSSEGERVSKIVTAYRNELSENQEYFLKMLSLHPHSVTERNFSAMVEGYSEEKHKNPWILENIIDPLKKIGLIEELKDITGSISYNAHPLMKLAYSTWFDKQGQRQAHERWAEAVKASPDISRYVDDISSLEELQPYLDIVEHYLKANKIETAWGIYYGRDVDYKLHDLGYAHRVLEFGKQFEEELKGEWKLNSNELSNLYNHLGLAYKEINQYKKLLFYVEKEFSAAKDTGDNNLILFHGYILCSAYLSYGNLNKARELLNQLKEVTQEKEIKQQSIESRQAVLARSELYLGSYIKAFSLMPKELIYSHEFDRIVHSYMHAEAYIRSGKFSEAETLLKKVKKEAENYHMYILKPHILKRYIWLALKQNNLRQARVYNNQRIELRKSLDLPYKDDGFLLVREGSYEQALREAEPYISSEGEEKFNKVLEIENLLIMAQAWHGKGETKRAKKTLNRATKLMKKTGCWREKDRWKETRKLLGLV